MNRYLLLGALFALCTSACNSNDGHDHDAHRMITEPGEPSAQLVLHVEARTAVGASVPLSDAKVYLSEGVGTETHHHHPEGDPHATTNDSGDVILSLIPDKEYVVHVEATGYDGIVRRVQQAVDTERNIWLTLNPEQKKTVTIPESGSIDVTLGDTAGGSASPVTLTIEAGDLGANSGSGDAISGDIEIRYGAWDPAVDDASSLPSDLLTADSSLVSYGMFHIEFSQNGETLNVKDGQTIAWSMQVNEQLQDMALAAAGLGNLNIYSLDHDSGLWVEDDVNRSFSSETGIVTAESTHFSHKNCDQPPPYAATSCLDIEVVDEKGNRLNQADVSIQGRGGARQGCNEIACVLGDANGEPVFDEEGRIMGVIPVAGDIGYTASARVHVVNGRWVSGQTSTSTLCDDINVGCGTGNCSTARIVLPMCHLDDEPCSSRDDCCDDDTDRACRIGAGSDVPSVCGECIQEGQTCTSSEECCNGLTCTDFQCFRN